MKPDFMCRSRSLDPGTAVLWLIAVGTVVAAAFWAGNDFQLEMKPAGRGAGDEVTCTLILLCLDLFIDFLFAFLPVFFFIKVRPFTYSYFFLLFTQS